MGVSRLPSIKQARPDLAATLVNPTDASISIGARKKVAWRCPQHLEPFWQSVANRVNGAGCPYCSNKQVLPGFNDMATTHPQLAQELISTNPTSIIAGTQKTLRWRCPQGHEYECRGDHRARLHVGCSYCAGKQVLPGFNDMATTHPELASELVGVDPTSVIAGTNRKLLWRCPEGHEYQATGNTRTRRRADGSHRGCPYCSNSQLLVGYNDLATTHPDFAAALIDPDPTTIKAGSKTKGLWRCPNHPQPFIAAIQDHVNGHWGCGICKGYQVVPGFNDLATTHPDHAADLFDEDPTTLTAGSHKKVLWRCPNHAEPFTASVANKVNSRGCTYCRGFAVLPGFNDMATTHPELAVELLHLDPTTVIAGARKRYSWRCSRCSHEWTANGDARTNNGSGCPACAPRGYDPTQPGYFYLLARHGEQQVGITSNLKRRIAQHREKGDWDLLDSAGPFDGQITADTERAIKAWLKTKVGRIKGTHENWSTADLEVTTLRELFTRANVDFPPVLPPVAGQTAFGRLSGA